MILNLNVGVLGHVDSGKTTLAKALSEIASTAAFDKNPQSQARQITLDLGFSAVACPLPDHLQNGRYDRLQFTFVDCPGHAKLIRTIIGGAQIIDIMILVVDIQKGIQTQTAECLVIGELTCQHLLVVLNKIDLLDATKRDKTIEKTTKKLRTILNETKFQHPIIIHPLSANSGENIPEFLDILKRTAFQPQRHTNEPFLFAVDHCFLIKGQGTVCTGTILQGTINVNDSIEIPSAKLCKKVKSIQMFRTALLAASQGDRIGICITQFDPHLLERGIICQPNYVAGIRAAVIRLNVIKYYKGSIKSKSKFHINVGHEMAMANCTLFTSEKEMFNVDEQYEYLDRFSEEERNGKHTFCLLEFDKVIFAAPNALLIAAKLDMDANTNQCRIAFWDHLNTNLSASIKNIKIFKEKSKEGSVQRIVNDHEIIVDHLFKKESNRQIFIGMKIVLSTGEIGFIDSTFGSTSKVKVRLPDGLAIDTQAMIKQNQMKDIKVILKFKKFMNEENKITS